MASDAPVDGRIKVGDVCHDVLGSGTLQVVCKAADSVSEFASREDFNLVEYKTHPLLDVDDSQSVWTCVYLPNEPTVSFNGTYDFPDGRLARVPIETASQDLQRIQDRLIVGIFKALFATATQENQASSAAAMADVAAHAGVPEALVDEAC